MFQKARVKASAQHGCLHSSQTVPIQGREAGARWCFKVLVSGPGGPSRGWVAGAFPELAGAWPGPRDGGMPLTSLPEPSLLTVLALAGLKWVPGANPTVWGGECKPMALAAGSYSPQNTGDVTVCSRRAVVVRVT